MGHSNVGEFYKVLPLGEEPKVAHGYWGRERISLSNLKWSPQTQVHTSNTKKIQ